MTFSVPAVDAGVLAEILSPSLVIFRDRVISNIETMIRMAGGVDRLRPHCKTHKMHAVVRLMLERGIRKHKAATVAEAEMLAEAGAEDVMLAYNPVGPNIQRIIRLAVRYPSCQFSVTADHPAPVQELSQAASREPGVRIGVYLDVNTGLNRTGLAPESALAMQVYRQIAVSPGIFAAGFHVYDGQHRQSNPDDRRQAVLKEWRRVQTFRQQCEATGLSVQVLVCGGTPTFPAYSQLEDQGIELSPGTVIFHDAGYGSLFPDLPFQVAGFVLTRVISRPSRDRITLDLGNKAVAADPPKGHRVIFPELPDAVQDLHNEEHLVLVTPEAERYSPGDVLLGIPVHICPTSALHASVVVLENGRRADEWPVTSRNRRLTV